MTCEQPVEEEEHARIRVLLDQLADKWSVLVLKACMDGPVRFNAIKRHVTGVSQKTLTQCLRRLERNGILERRVISAAPLGVEYLITPLGWTLAEPYRALQAWTEQHLSEVVRAQHAFDRRTGTPPPVGVAVSLPAEAQTSR